MQSRQSRSQAWSALLYTGKVLRTWGRPALFDPSKGTWATTGAFAFPNRGWPGHSDHSTVFLTDGRVLVVGVNVRSAGASAQMVERYDPSTARWTALGSPALRRMQSEVTYLPDGNVLVAGGDITNQGTTVQ